MNQNYTFEIYSQKNCPACTMSKALLKNRGYTVTEVLVDSSPEAKQQFFQKIPNARTVPQIFVNGTHLGGLKELQEYLQKL
jgi:glutaredoxin 3